MYIYGISESYTGLEMKRTKIIKETKKTYKVETYIDPFYKLNISKSDPALAFTPQEAIEKYITKKEAGLAILREKIERLQVLIAEANDLY